MLDIEGFLAVRDLAERLEVSEMTVRRDLKRLAGQGHVRLVHGGAAPLHGTLRTPDFIARADLAAPAKRTVASRAAELVGAGDTIAIDAGTTAFALASALPTELPLRVVTNSVPVLQLMLTRPACHVVVVGGEIIASSQALVGPLSVTSAHALRVQKYFLGAAGVDAEGVYVETDIERPTKLAMMQMAEEVVLLADSEKFGRFAPVKLCGLGAIDRVVSEYPLPERVGELVRRR